MWCAKRGGLQSSFAVHSMVTMVTNATATAMAVAAAVAAANEALAVPVAVVTASADDISVGAGDVMLTKVGSAAKVPGF